MASMTGMTSFGQTKNGFDNIETIIKNQRRSDFFNPDDYVISYNYDSLFARSWSYLDTEIGRIMSSSGNYSWYNLHFTGNDKFYEIRGFHYNHTFKSSKHCGTFRFDYQNELLYMKLAECEEVADTALSISTRQFLIEPVFAVTENFDERIYKAIYLTQKKQKKDDNSGIIPFKEVLLLVDCTTTWDTSIEEIIKKWNATKPEKMYVRVYIR